MTIAMTYEEAYQKYKDVIERFCLSHTDNNRYYAEEATSETFQTLFEKWDSLNSHEDKVLLTWLYRTAINKIREQHRNEPPAYLNIDDEENQNLIEKRLLEDGSIPDEYEEFEKYEVYLTQIKQILKKKELILFEYIVVKRLTYKQVSNYLKISESAVKMRWYRLQNKIHPFAIKL